MDMNWYDVFHLGYCFISHDAPAFPSSTSILITVFIYLLPFNLHSILLFSPITTADRSLFVPFQFPLKPSMPARTTTPSAVHLK